MTKVWPSFVTKDLGPDDDAEMFRRWQVYDREMRALIAAGGVHQDEDGWWFDDATGEVIGPDPEIERPMMKGDSIPEPINFAEAFPEWAASLAAKAKKLPKRA
jgi:hypothetical protein